MKQHGFFPILRLYVKHNLGRLTRTCLDRNMSKPGFKAM
ncbi:hypothetical protein L581_3686 [Serratia fonticola AU-AP2C]|nr:hypothetical protein L581_3686 [Serratia fonticola AU-AP2C]